MKFFKREGLQRGTSNKIYVALNLFSVSHYRTLLAGRDGDLIFWHDGEMANFFLQKSRKCPGSNFLEREIENSLGNVAVIGNLSDHARTFLHDHGVEVLTHFPVPFVDQDVVSEIEVKNGSTILVTLPSPLQEEVALSLSRRLDNCTFYCIGGALAMLVNKHLEAPLFFRSLKIEWLYRLRSDPVRRVKRLLKSIFLFFWNFKFIIKLRFREVSEDE